MTASELAEAGEVCSVYEPFGHHLQRDIWDSVLLILIVKLTGLRNSWRGDLIPRTLIQSCLNRLLGGGAL